MEKKTLISFAIISFLALYVGDRFGGLIDEKRNMMKGIENACDNIGGAILTNPFDFSFGGAGLLCALVCFLAVWVVWAAFFAMPRNYRDGEEQGSAKWGTLAQGKRFKNLKEPDKNILFTDNYGMAVKRDGFDLKLDRNLNVLIIGGSGSGKTRYFVKPNLMQLFGDYFVTDPKGTCLEETGHLFEDEGYRILSVNCVDFSKSLCINPLQYVRSDADILSFVNCLIRNTTPDKSSGGDPFWENSEKLLYTSLIALLRDWFPPSDYTLPNVLFLLSLASASEEDENAKSSLDYIFDQLETGKRYMSKQEQQQREHDDNIREIRAEDPQANYVPSDMRSNKTGRCVGDTEGVDPNEDLALFYYKEFKKAAGKTLKSILISCAVRLAPIRLDEMSRILSGAPDENGKPTARCELELDKLGEEDSKRIIFCVMSDTDPTFNWLLAILNWQAINVLCTKANLEHGGRLPRFVDFVFDEFANIGTLPDIEKTIAVTRSRNIGLSIILQSVSQLNNNYSEDAAKIIQDNCDSLVFLGGKSSDTNKAISETIGQQTLTTRTFNQSKGQNPSYTHNYQASGRALMDAAEVGKIPRDEALVLITGTDPLRDKKYTLEKHPRYPKIDPGHPGAEYDDPFDFIAYTKRRREADRRTIKRLERGERPKTERHEGANVNEP